jgi:type I restriction enzyme, S subunit
MNHETAALLEKHFDLAFAAPDGIKKLRELILTLAMQGKLVPQDPRDQSAGEFLKAIEGEKLRLVEEGKIKQSQPLSIKHEAPYRLAKGWLWVKFEDIVEISSGVTKGRKLNSREIVNLPYLRVANVQRGYLDLEIMKEIEIAKDEIQRFELKKRDLLITEGGDWDKVGRTAIWNNEIAQCIHQNHVFKARCILETQNERWLEKYLNSSVARGYFADASKQTTNLASINKTQLRGCPIALPPLAEQRRIVTKIDRLMERCDELEKLRNDRHQKRVTVHTAALDRLLASATSIATSSGAIATSSLPRRRESRLSASHQKDIALEAGLLDSRLRGNDGGEAFADAWSFITKHFGELYRVKENVAELRKAILQLAVMGKLVPQDPTDEPASELLRAIGEEKERMLKGGKIKHLKPQIEIKPEEVPYQLPKGWVWVRLGNVSQILGGFAYKSNFFKGEGNRQVLRLGNIRPDLIRLNENPVFIDDSLGEATSEFCLRKNDILITMTGTRSKRDYLYTVRVEENPVNGVLLYLNQRVGAIRLFFDTRYVNLALKVETLKDIIFLSATGSANQANIGISNLREWIIPLPPLAEQHRIVTKIDRLMALCDRLEQQIDAATEKQTALLNAIVTQV